MKKKLLLVFSLLLILPLTVRAEAGTNVKTVEATVNKNTITFNGTTQDDSVAVMCKLLSGNSEVDKLSVEVNATVFTGSFVAEETGSYTVACANYDGGTIVTDEAVVSTMATFTVTFNTNGGSNIAPVEVEYGNTVAEPDAPTKENKTFAGWYEDSTLITPFDFTKHITADTTIYADWGVETSQLQVIFFGEGGTYQVDFEADDSINPEPLGEPVNSSHRYFVTKGGEVTLTAVPSNGYHFVGWHNIHEENGNEWVVDDIVSEEAIYQFNITTYKNLTPVFVANAQNSSTFTVTFNTNGGSNINPINVEAGQLLMLPQNPTRDGFVFLDWYEDDTLTTWFDPSQPITKNITLYAKWHEGEHRNADQLQIWAETGGKVAARYTPSEPNVYEMDSKDGTDFVPRGEVVQFYVGDQVTAIARADEGYRFVGWKHVDIEYGADNPSEEHPSACMGETFSTSATYTYTPKVTVIDGDEEPIKYVCASFEKEPTEETYNLSDTDGNKISFTEIEDKTFTFVIADLSNLTDEQLAEIDPPMSREDYEEIKSSIIEATRKYGTLISFLEIEVLDEHNTSLEDGPFTIRLKLTDEMKKYNTFKLIYVKDDLSFGDIINLKVEGDYLVGTLPHLSAYVLAGSVEETSSTTNATSSPKTGDNILVWIVALAVSGIGILIIILSSLKTKKVK